MFTVPLPNFRRTEGKIAFRIMDPAKEGGETREEKGTEREDERDAPIGAKGKENLPGNRRIN